VVADVGIVVVVQGHGCIAADTPVIIDRLDYPLGAGVAGDLQAGVGPIVVADLRACIGREHDGGKPAYVAV
jgi:hypothetical protein